MKTGFTFRNKHSSELGLVMVTKSRPILPERRSKPLELPNADGSMEYAAANEYGRAFFKNRTFTVGLCLYASDIYDMERKLSRVAVWLSGNGRLWFDDMPSVYWEAAVIGQIDYAPEQSGTKAVLSVSFDIKPFSAAFFDVLSGPKLGDPVMLGAHIKLGDETTFTFSVSGGGSFTVLNAGTAPARPIFIISHNDTTEYAAPTWTMVCGERSFGYSAKFGPYKSMTIDTENYTCDASGYAGGSDRMGGFVGEFFELMPGNNIIDFAGEENINYTISVSYVPRFIWDADFGGGEDA